MRVVLLHSNDLHSRLEQAAQIASYISAERRIYGDDRLLVLDCGDHMDRMRMETEGSDGLVNIELLNAAGYDAVTLGNNEGLTYTREELAYAYREHAKFPVVCANMLDMETGERPEWLLPSYIIVKNGLRIGITAVTAAFADFYCLLGWQATEPFEELRRQVATLRDQVDIVIVLSHLGLPSDEKLAAEVPGVDLILGAHTHHLLLEPLVRGTTTICAAGKFGEYLGRVELDLDLDTGRPVIRASCVPMAAEKLEERAAAIIGSFLDTGRQRLDREVVTLAKPLPAGNGTDAPLANLLAAGLRKWAGADIGLVNTGQLLGGLATGRVTAGQLHALCPSPINPCQMQLTGADLLQALEESLLDEFRSKPIKGFGFRGEVLGSLAVDGLQIVYDWGRPPYARITKITIGGKALEPDAFYLVGTIDMFTFGVGYLSLKNSLNLRYFLPEFIRDVLASQLQQESELEHCFLNRWSSNFMQNE
ncbi:bifunctional metallophosphatase/5'-nucleotidase [Paenibacillus sp. MAHUQ-46]|uniref:Bifunctional metallophosphatase/5'-nucleotidase n=1 Tax=Paenibacillus roseus TaxID=2798579 RepID=A0A934J3J7_9BACL|nr:bifunctional metallophosphatase/5'-nucleotidase [Paenibacillus roseus]